jgi:hypothetical protein
MATLIPYLSGNVAITPIEMNLLAQGLDSRMDTLLGGRTFLMALSFSSASSGPNGETIYGSTPYECMGQCYHFLDGVVHYARYAPGFKPKTITVPDPTTGTSVSSNFGGWSHDEDFFDTLLPLLIPISYDVANRVVTVQDIPAASYPAWLKQIASVSIFEYSMRCMTVMLQGPEDDEPKEYWIKEQSCPIPTKRYELGLMEIIIEGKTQVTIPVTTKFRVTRLHNAQPRPCAVTLGTASVTLGPYECQTWQDGVRSPFRYFSEFRGVDGRHFWFHPRVPNGGTYFRGVTSASSEQGNIVGNPAVIYDFVKRLTNPLNFAFFVKDPSVNIADIFTLSPNIRTKFGKKDAIETALDHNWVLGDLLHHRGKFSIARTTGHPAAPVTTFEECEFPGYQPLSTFIEYMAARGITVTTDATTGALKLQNTDATKRVDLIQHGTNFLKSLNPAGPTLTWLTTPAQNIDGAGYVIERAIFEGTIGGQPFQSPSGNNGVLLSATAGYRITRRTLTNTARTAPATRLPNGQFVTLVGVPLSVITEVVSTPSAMTGIHNLSLSELLKLTKFGAGPTDTEPGGLVQFANAAIALTPFGIWITFEERVDARYIPDLVATDPLNPTWYYNLFDNRLSYNAALDKWVLKHCIRFRGNGWGWGEHGRDNAASFDPVYGRIAVKGYQNDVIAPGGGDHTLIDQEARATGVSVLRRLDISEIGNAAQGQRFLTTPRPGNPGEPPFVQMDKLVEFMENYHSSGWYNASTMGNTNRGHLLAAGRASEARGPTLAKALTIYDYNAAAMTINQLVTGRPLDYTAFAFVVGPKILSFVPDPVGTNVQRNLTGLPSYAMNGPAPVDAFTRLDNAANRLYWEYLFGTILGIQFKTISQFPENFNTFKTLRWEFRTAKAVATGSVSNAAFSGTRKIYEGNTESLAFWFIVFSGKVTLNLTDFAWNPSTFSQFFPVGLVTVLDGVSLNLNTAYTNVEWISIADVKAAFVSRGIPWHYAEAFTPLQLSTLTLGDLIKHEGLSNNSVVYEGEVASCDSNVRFINAPNDPPGATHPVAVAGVARLNATVAVPVTITSDQFTYKKHAFVLATDAATAQWKTSPPTPFPSTIFEFQNRTETDKHPSFRLNAHVRSFQELLGSASGASMNIEIIGLQSQPPWHPSDFFEAIPNTLPGFPGSDPAHPYGNPNFAQPGRVRWAKTAGPRVFADIDVGAYNFFAAPPSFVPAPLEQTWMAVQVSSTFAGATLEVFQIQQPAFATAIDWWLESDDAYLASKSGVYQAPYRDVTGTGHTYQECTNGITIIRPTTDSNRRVLFDLNYLRITL